MKTDDFFDERGKLLFPIKNNNFEFKQSTVSINHKNVFRGIHINPFDKLVTCVKGTILDIIINFNEKSSDYLIPKYYTLSSTNENNQLFIPSNYGHAFLSLEDESILLYHFNGIYTDDNTKHIHYLDPTLNIYLPISNNEIIISKKDNCYHFIKPIEYMLLGSSGFLGSNILNILKKQEKNVFICNCRLDNISEIESCIKIYNPKYIISSAGLTGNPNISWCDENKIETIETNITFQLTLAKICRVYKKHLTIIGSGGIFDNKRFYRENDSGNFYNNFYSISRIYLETLLKEYDNLLYVRVNYPISSTKSPKNLITKLKNFTFIENKEFSLTYIDELFPLLIQMIEENKTGIVNLVNNGSINLLDIMKIYSSYKNINYTEKKEIDSSKSNAKLEIGQLQQYNVSSANDAVHKCIYNYFNNQNI